MRITPDIVRCPRGIVPKAAILRECDRNLPPSQPRGLLSLLYGHMSVLIESPGGDDEDAQRERERGRRKTCVLLVVSVVIIIIVITHCFGLST